MKPVFNVVVVVWVALVLQSSAICQTPTKPSVKPKLDPCEATKKNAYFDGWNQGSEDDRLIYSVKIGESTNQQKIAILVEDIDGEGSYRLAAAEVIRTYFADSLVVAPEANLKLYIHGTKSMQLSNGSDVQSISVDVFVFATQTLVVGDEKRLVSGTLQLAHEGDTMKGYSQQEKSQAVREDIYKALSDYKQTWNKAAPKTPQQGGGF